MIHRSVKFAYAVCLIVAALQAFLALRTLDELGVGGPSYQLWVRDVADTASTAQVVETLVEFAAAEKVDVAKDVVDLNEPTGARHLYIAAGGGPAESWLAGDGYPDFSADVQTIVHPIEDLATTGIRGYYLLFGPEESATALQMELARIGLHGDLAPYPSLIELPRFVAYGAMLWCFILTALGVVALVGSGVILNAKAYGIQRLQGWSFGRILASDLKRLLGFALAAAAVVAGVTVAALLLYNGGNQIGNYFILAGVLLGTLIGIALLTHVLALAVTRKTPVVAAIKGEVSSTLTMVAAYIVRVPALLITAAVLVMAIHGTQQVIAREQAHTAWTTAGDAVYLMVNGSVSEGRQDLDARLGAMIRDSDAAGDVVLANQLKGATMFPNPELAGRDFLIVNDTYLEQQEVVDADGARISPATEPTARLLLPADLEPSAGAVQKAVADWLAFVGQSPGGTYTAPLPATFLPTGATLFTYGMVFDPSAPAQVTDPIVLALPDASPELSDDVLAAFATTGGVVFLDPEVALEQVTAHELGAYVISLNPVGQNAADQYRDLLRDYRLQLFNVAAALGVLLMSGVAVSIIYTRRSRQAIFVRHINGWSFVRTHRWLLLLEVALAVVVGSWATGQAWAASQAAQQPGGTVPGTGLVLGAAEPVVNLAVVAASLVLVIVAIATASSRLIRTHSADA